jgi:hypothetical protein
MFVYSKTLMTYLPAHCRHSLADVFSELSITGASLALLLVFLQVAQAFNIILTEVVVAIHYMACKHAGPTCDPTTARQAQIH